MTEQRPRFRYPLAAPDLSGSENTYVQECLRSNWISSRGPFIEEFEGRFAKRFDARQAVATCNGTAALHLALLALGIKSGDEVIVPSLTYVATANAVTYCGASAVFADSDRNSWCISPESVDRLLSSRTRAIIPVHLYGQPCAMEALRQIADGRGIQIVEDCAEALGATVDGRQVGGIGAVGVFSFFGNKILTTGEGGMVVTADEEIAARVRLLRGQGVDAHRAYWFPALGYNYRMTNIQAAIGLGQIEHVDQLLDDRLRIAHWYGQRLKRSDLVIPAEIGGTTNVHWLFSALCADRERRDDLIAGLASEGIETRPFFHPLHDLPMYRGHRSDGGCPVASELAGRGINLPTSSYLREEDVEAIAAALLRRLH